MYVEKDDDDDDSHSRKDDESTECYSSDSHFNAVGGSTAASAHQSSSRTFNCDEGKLMSNVTAANEASHTHHHQSYPDVRVDSTRVRSAKCNTTSYFVVLVVFVDLPATLHTCYTISTAHISFVVLHYTLKLFTYTLVFRLIILAWLDYFVFKHQISVCFAFIFLAFSLLHIVLSP